MNLIIYISRKWPLGMLSILKTCGHTFKTTEYWEHRILGPGSVATLLRFHYSAKLELKYKDFMDILWFNLRFPDTHNCGITLMFIEKESNM